MINREEDIAKQIFLQDNRLSWGCLHFAKSSSFVLRMFLEKLLTTLFVNDIVKINKMTKKVVKKTKFFVM